MKHFINLSRVPLEQQDRLWSLVLRRIVRFIKKEKHIDVERARILLVVYPDDREPRLWDARLRIRIASDLLTVQVGPCEKPDSALREAFDKMERKVRDLLASRRTSRRRCVSCRKTIRKSELMADSEDPGRFLYPRKHLLTRLASRELKAVEEDGCLPESFLSVEDVVDESLLLAWDRYCLRPTGLSAELWLLGIVQEVLQETVADWNACEPTADVGECPFEEEEDPRRDVDNWCEANSDPVGLALWKKSEAA